MPTDFSSQAANLPVLQNLIKRDPQAYREEFLRRYRHFLSILELHCQRPASESKDLIATIGFISAVSPCYPDVTATLPSQLAALLEEHHAALNGGVRAALLQALILLRNRGMMPPIRLLQLCFRLFACHDKALREKVFSFVVSDIKNVNVKHKDMALNKTLQNFIIGMIADASPTAAKYSLLAMIQLYRKNVWKDAKCVNVVAGALTGPHAKLRVAAVHFILGAHDDADMVDSDDEEMTAKSEARAEKLRERLNRDGAMTGKAKNKTKRALRRASKSSSKMKARAP